MINEISTGERSWNIIIPLEFQLERYAFFYSKKDGDAELYKIDSDLGFTLIKSYRDFRRTWRSILPVHFSSSKIILLFYDAQRGEAEFYSITMQGEFALLQTSYNWRRSWKSISTLRYHHNNLILFYDEILGQGELYRIDEFCRFSYLRSFDGWRKNWSLIVAVPFEENNIVIFYCQEFGDAEIYTATSDGNFEFVRSYKEWRSSWKLIVPVLCGNDRFLLFYDNKIKEQELYRLNCNGALVGAKHYPLRKYGINHFITFSNQTENLLYLSNEHNKLYLSQEPALTSVEYLFGQEYYLDGSNIARFHQQGDRKVTPRIDIVLQVMNEFHIRKANFACFFDAKTFYEFSTSDKEVYRIMNKRELIYTIPSGVQADEYILSLADRNGGNIVSRDKYRDRKDRFRWVVDNRGYPSKRLIDGLVIRDKLTLPKLNISVKVNNDSAQMAKELIERIYRY